MKAMLIMDMPSSCKNCSLKFKHEMGCKQKTFASCKMFPTLVIKNEKIRQEYCPLREVPQKKVDDLAIYMPFCDGFIEGYNQCIDEILGGVQNMAKHRMPKTRTEFEDALMDAFKSGCVCGYGIDHTVNMIEQERLGAEHYVGIITDEELEKRIGELLGGGE